MPKLDLIRERKAELNLFRLNLWDEISFAFACSSLDLLVKDFGNGKEPKLSKLILAKRSFTKMWKSEVNLRSNEAKDDTRITWAADSARRFSGFWRARLKNSVFDLKIRIGSDSEEEVKSDITSSTKSFKRRTLEPWKACVCKFRSSELTKIWQDWLSDRIFSRWNFIFEGYE